MTRLTQPFEIIDLWEATDELQSVIDYAEASHSSAEHGLMVELPLSSVHNLLKYLRYLEEICSD